MKKTKKRILLIVISAFITLCLVFGVFILIDVSDGNVSGTTYVTNYQTGSGIEDWSRYEVDITLNMGCDTEFYTNEGDYLLYKNAKYYDYYIEINYSCSFHIADDFEAFFVLSNMKEGSEERHVVTNIETTHWLQFDSIVVKYSDLLPSFVYEDRSDSDMKKIREFHIVEVWVRTVL